MGKLGQTEPAHKSLLLLVSFPSRCLLLPILPAASGNSLTAGEPVQPTNPAESWTGNVGPTALGEKELPVTVVLG